MKTKLTVSISEQSKEQIQKFVKKNHINMSSMTEQLWINHIKKEQKNEKV